MSIRCSLRTFYGGIVTYFSRRCALGRPVTDRRAYGNGGVHRFPRGKSPLYARRTPRASCALAADVVGGERFAKNVRGGRNRPRFGRKRSMLRWMGRGPICSCGRHQSSEPSNAVEPTEVEGRPLVMLLGSSRLLAQDGALALDTVDPSTSLRNLDTRARFHPGSGWWCTNSAWWTDGRCLRPAPMPHDMDLARRRRRSSKRGQAARVPTLGATLTGTGNVDSRPIDHTTPSR